MSSIEEVRSERIKKLAALKEKGIDPYPAVSHRTYSIARFQSEFAALADAKQPVTIAGRIMSKRGQGGVTFCDIFDGTSKTQIFLKSDEMDAAQYALFTETVDVGDFLEASGAAYLTKRGEQSLFVSNWSMLTKSLRPIPDA
ncbi:MAG TPA: OB-fold nucleic acid binding domain-containing protein, partial [Candidatus Paceibacterota bacterium]|nr:OB-fold nucleic acid binding domain-containing protein [Candidatus Paceibacterota bacterium]